MPKRDELKNRVEEIFTDSKSSSLENDGVFHVAFENAAVGMCLTGIDGRFIMVNQAFANILGFDREEIAGKSFQALTYPEDYPIGGEAMQAMLAGQTNTAKIQKRYVHKDGHPIWAELNITLIRDADGKPMQFVSLVQDVSEQKNTALQLEKRVRELNCLNDIGHKIDEQPPLAEFLEWVARRVPEAMLYPKECIVAVEYEGQIYGNREALEMSSKVVGGIRVAGVLLGWLHIAYSQQRSFIDAESALVGGIVSRLSGYIQTIHQQEHAEHHSRELTILNEMALELTSVLDLQTIVETIHQYTAQLTDATNFFVALYDPGDQTVSFPIAYSDGERTQINTRPLGNALTDYIIRHGEPLLLTDNVVQRAEQYGIQLILYGKPVPAESWLGVPIIYGEQTIGVIAIQSITIPGLFKEYDREIMTNIARSAANAIALARQYQQTQAALGEVRDSQGFVTRIVDFLPEAIFVIDRQGKVIAWNKAMEQLTGIAAQDMLGKGDYEYSIIFYGERRPILIDLVALPDEELEQKYSTISRQGDILVAETQKLTFRGRETYLGGRATALRDSKGELVGAIEIVQDVTERRRIEEANIKRANEMAVVVEVSTIVATVLDPQELLQTVVDLTKERFGLYHAHIYTLDEPGENLILVRGSGDAGRKMLSRRWEIPLGSEQSLVARAARSRKGVIVANVQEDPGFLPNEFLPDTVSEMAIPLIVGETLLGVLDVQSDQPDYFTKEEVSTFTTLGYQAAVALQNARLYTRTQAALAEAEALYRGSGLIARAETIGGVLKALVDSTALAKLDRANILFFDRPWDDRQPDTLTVGALWEKSGAASAAPIGTVYPFTRFPGFQFLDRSGAVVISDIMTDERVDNNLRSVFQRLGMQSVIACPFKSSEKWFAILSGQASQKFYLSEEEVRRVNSLMDQAATVIQNLVFLERNRSQIQREQTLRQITTQVRGSMDPDIILRTVVRELGEALGRKTYILLGNESESGNAPKEQVTDD